jgi:hypothetical protein
MGIPFFGGHRKQAGEQKKPTDDIGEDPQIIDFDPELATDATADSLKFVRQYGIGK